MYEGHLSVSVRKKEKCGTAYRYQTSILDQHCHFLILLMEKPAFFLHTILNLWGAFIL